MNMHSASLSILSAVLCLGGLSAQDVPSKDTHHSRVAIPHTRLKAQRHAFDLDQDHDFQFFRGHRSEDGIIHNRFHQTYRGVRVWGSEVITHTHEDGVEKAPSSRKLFPRIRMAVEPTLREREALAIVHQDMNPKGPYLFEPTIERVIYPIEVQKVLPGRERKAVLNAMDVTDEVTQYCLAYHLHAELENGIDPVTSMDYMIDAHSGTILKKWSSLHRADARGTGYSKYNGTVELFTNSTDSGFELKDVTRGSNYVTNMNSATDGFGTIYTDADNTWGDGQQYDQGLSTTSDNGQTAAVDTAFAQQVTWDMFKNVFGRDGIRGSNIPTYIRVHYGINSGDAFYKDSCKCIAVGDAKPGYSDQTDLQTVAHELGHAFNAGSAGLSLAGNTAGGINESNSDITCANAYFYLRRNGGIGNTLPSDISPSDIGWDLFHELGPTLRYMSKPSKDGKSPDAWSKGIENVDIHYSCGPNNRMYFFLSCGASNDSQSEFYSSFTPNGFSGIGLDKASRIWYKAMTSYLSYSSKYVQAREACLNAAKDLYGIWGTEYKAVMNAYAAINVGYPAPDGVKVLINPVNASILSCDTFQFKTEVLGTVNSALTWTCSGGSVNGNGLYTAPIIPGIYSVTATSVEDSTQSATATVTVNSERITNGGFENDKTGWTFSYGIFGSFSNHPAYEGKNNICFGGMGRKMQQYLYQTVSIPSAVTKANLNFYLAIETDETTTDTAKDTLSFQVRNTVGTMITTLATYSNLDKTSGYEKKTIDLSAYRGQTIQIYFLANEDSATKTSFCLDNVSMLTE